MNRQLENVSVILASYNERQNIAYIVQMLVEVLTKAKVDFEILLVDDNSPDGTAEEYKKLQKLMPNVRLLLHQRPGKMGLGSAYIDGLKFTKYDFIVIMDADLSHHPKYILDMIRIQREGGYDIVSGTRYRNGGGASGWSWKRVIISRTANFIAQFLLRLTMSDLTGSFRLYRRSLFEKILENVHSKGYIFQVEIAARAIRQFKAKVAESPIIFIERIYGESKLGAQEIYSYLIGIFKLFIEL
ncbi:bifunctional Nucleotide-diphospho-sugar transferases/Glycosyltransferase 2-like/DPM1-like [Babesia duncani]|uniref:Dolichol-phosphate mannosyltransferase subunit 1 n=1 Tax=Babesia duncani TaxID=323732 RepID=A0AAD9PIY1_9APIC|nr:bifunctional Nucleotide-diphospho-sugar transferases/Glycosyltransferase 2-like/DPM1-like [Babesia duncani]